MALPLKVKSMRSSKPKSDEFVSMSLYFLGTNSKNRSFYTQISQELYLVKGLKANLLIGNEILAIKKLIINITNKTAMISSCEVIISVIA